MVCRGFEIQALWDQLLIHLRKSILFSQVVRMCE